MSARACKGNKGSLVQTMEIIDIENDVPEHSKNPNQNVNSKSNTPPQTPTPTSMDEHGESANLLTQE